MKIYLRRSFTLVELLITMATGVLICLLFSQTISSVGRMVEWNSKSINSAAQANLIFERMRIDFQQMPKRLDIGYQMTNSDIGTDFIRIISEVNGYEGTRKVSLIGYKLTQDKDGYISLQRGAHGYKWADYGFMGLLPNGTPVSLCSLPSSLDLQANDYDLLSTGIINIALAFQIKSNGQFSNSPPYISLNSNQAPQSINITNLASIIVGIVLLDKNSSRNIHPEENRVIIKKFTDVPNGIMPVSHWGSNLEVNFPEFQKGVSKSIAQSIQVYQRIYPLE